jgi:hypothetical protein
MANQEELAICRRRGHNTDCSLKKGWAQCTWCGIWLRQIETTEEREDTPPVNEQNELMALRKKYVDAGGDPKKLP